MDRQLARRQFLGFLAGSPLLATPAVTSVIASLLACASDQAFAQSYDALRRIASGRLSTWSSNMNKIRNGAFFAIAATACTLLVPEGAGRLDPCGQVSA
jgi:hypothetical protein